MVEVKVIIKEIKRIGNCCCNVVLRIESPNSGCFDETTECYDFSDILDKLHTGDAILIQKRNRKKRE